MNKQTADISPKENRACENCAYYGEKTISSIKKIYNFWHTKVLSKETIEIKKTLCYYFFEGGTDNKVARNGGTIIHSISFGEYSTIDPLCFPEGRFFKKI